MPRDDDVRGRLARHVLTDGFHIILDLRSSCGSWIADAETGERYLDLYSFFASSPLGINPPGVTGDPEFMALLARRGKEETGVVIPLTDPEAFIKGSAEAGVLRIIH